MADWDLPRDPLAALRAGDPKPFEAFVRSHARTLYAFFRRQGAGLHKAEDLAQEVFLKLHSHAQEYRPDERFRAFVLRMARNIWIDDRRRAGARLSPGSLERRTPSGEPVDVGVVSGLSEETGPFEHAVTVEEGARLHAALQELSAHHRAVFELGGLEELSYAEVSSLLGIPVGTVKSRMFHALRKLRQALETEEGAA
jgi:RNA polymerase sigma-70 factor (ECF subfamily)